MASIKTKFTVGLFIAVGITLTIVAVIWLGLSKYLEKGQLYTAYFDESVQGLDRDSPVKYRGVPVGRVVSVGVAPDGTLVQVVLKIETKLEVRSDQETIGDTVAQLKSIGITGIMFLELDRMKTGSPDLSPKLSFQPKYPVIRTRPSEIKLFVEGVNDVLNQFKAIDGKGLTDSAKAALHKLEAAVEALQIREISADVRLTLNRINRLLTEERINRIIDRMGGAADSVESLMSSARKVVARFERIISSNETGINTAVTGVNRVVLEADDTISRLNRIVVDNEQALADAVSGIGNSVRNLEALLAEGHRLILQGNSSLAELNPRLQAVLAQLELTVENLKRFADSIAAQPSQLLFGEPPVPRPIEPPDTEAK